MVKTTHNLIMSTVRDISILALEFSGGGRKDFHFMSSAVTVDCSHMTVSSSALWSGFSQPSNFANRHVCQQCGSWSDAGHNRRKVIWTRPHLCGNSSAETMYDERD